MAGLRWAVVMSRFLLKRFRHDPKNCQMQMSNVDRCRPCVARYIIWCVTTSTISSTYRSSWQKRFHLPRSGGGLGSISGRFQNGGFVVALLLLLDPFSQRDQNMALETGTYIDSLVATNPTATDALAQADDHLRLIKATLKATFPSITGAVTLTHTQINDLQNLQGVLSAPSGTRMLFQQAAAPTGWTIDATHNDKALRIVNGSVAPGTGGSAAFSAAFASQTPAGSVSTSIGGTINITRLRSVRYPLTATLLPPTSQAMLNGNLTSTNSMRTRWSPRS